MNKAYKLFEMDDEGRLYPLFIGRDIEVPVGKWMHAEFIPTKGFASRGGWHVGEIPDAPWLKSYDGSNTGKYKSKRSKKFKRVWCEVEYNNNHNYDDIVKKLPKKCFEDSVPEDGCYKFKETGCNRIWVITSDIKITKILTEKERVQILIAMGYDEVAAYRKYKIAMEKRMATLRKKQLKII